MNEILKNAPFNSYWLIVSKKRKDVPKEFDGGFPDSSYDTVTLYKKGICFHCIAFKLFNKTSVYTIDKTIYGKPDGKNRLPKKSDYLYFLDGGLFREDVITKVELDQLEKVFNKYFKDSIKS